MSDSVPTPQTTIANVAKRAGVSIATVSRVINQTAPVAVETAARVRAAITELNYRPSAAARGLASKRTNMVGLLTTDIATPFFTPILRGIEAGVLAALLKGHDLETAVQWGAAHGILVQETPGDITMIEENILLAEVKRAQAGSGVKAVR